MRRLLIVSLLLMLTAACNRIKDPVSVDLGPSLSGRVYDAATRAPIAGVQVEVGERRTTSADSGAYYVVGVGRGMQPLTASKAGYATYTTGIIVDDAISPRDIYLERE